MSLYEAQRMGQAQGVGQPGGVAYGHVPQQPNLGLGPNRYVPPTFNWGRGQDGRPDRTQMDWNQMQAFFMPQHTNSPFANPYMQQLQGMLGQFSQQYGGPNRRPTMPNFGSFNPGFGGPTSFYDQMRGGGYGDSEGWGERGDYPMMPQFNPYMLAQRGLRGMDFNQMFDPRYAMLLGLGGLGAMQPNGPPPQMSGLKPGPGGG